MKSEVYKACTGKASSKFHLQNLMGRQYIKHICRMEDNEYKEKFDGKPRRKQSFGRPRSWKDNNKKRDCGDVEWTKPAQDLIHRRTS